MIVARKLLLLNLNAKRDSVNDDSSGRDRHNAKIRLQTLFAPGGNASFSQQRIDRILPAQRPRGETRSRRSTANQSCSISPGGGPMSTS